MKKFDADAARAEMMILAGMLKRAEREHDYESNHYDDNKDRYEQLKRQLERQAKKR